MRFIYKTTLKTSKISLLALLILFIEPVFAQRLKGRVISCQENYYSVREVYGKLKKGIKLSDSLFHDHFFSYDENGNIDHMIDFNPDGTTNCKYFAEKDHGNNHFESVFARFDHAMRMDKKTFLIESVQYPSGEFCAMSYKYDSIGRPVEETIFDLMGQVLNTIAIKRDGTGHFVEYAGADGSVDRYHYENNGNLTRWSSGTPDGNTTITTYKYDHFGDVAEEYVDNFFKSSYKYHIEHNTYQYQYDTHGNWTERTDFEHDIPVRLVIRTIVYASDEETTNLRIQPRKR
jgi:hypothetical protein